MEALRTKNSVVGKQNHLAVVRRPVAEDWEIRRIPGLELGGPDEPLKRMLLAVALHEKETLDPLAEFSTVALNHSQAAAMMDAQSRVSGYRLVQLKAFCAKRDFELETWVAGMLTDAPLENVVWEGAWSLGDSVLLYIKGSMA